MHITMVKKRLASGEPCRKCAQAEEFLKSRGLWDRIDEVVWADETDPSSPGMRLGAQLGVNLAPFFVARDDRDRQTVYESVLKLVNEQLTEPKPSSSDTPSTDDFDIVAEAQALAERHPSEVLRFGLERWGASLGIAFSGAEDVVLVHMASETGLPFTVFCLDTGRLHPETYRFIDAVRRRYRIEIMMMSPEAEPLQAFVKQKGLFSFYEDGHEECCSIRKVEPLRRMLLTLRAWATGQRRDQSPATRSAIAVLERDRTFEGLQGKTLVKMNPLAAWTSAQVWQY